MKFFCHFFHSYVNFFSTLNKKNSPSSSVYKGFELFLFFLSSFVQDYFFILFYILDLLLLPKTSWFIFFRRGALLGELYTVFRLEKTITLKKE